jgi:hypothetical protein
MMTSLIVFLPLLSHPVFAAAAAAEKMNLNLVVDAKTLKFQDVNHSKKPVPGDLSTVLGTLFPGAPANNTQIGTYRCTFPWEGWVNSTQGVPVTLSIQVFDMKNKGQIVVVGDEPSVEAVGKPVAGVIAGGTGNFTGIRGTATLTAEPMQGTNIPVKVEFDIMH